ncbi:hypothetical protein LRK54_15470 [Rhodanobacter denitrificans]|uniref:hypothetical protein n=1 Tax=Rhodanobacter sp. OR92 TaxID=1076524 RepID=UPI0005679F76|nr:MULTISPECIES: hypothetical protein [Rhodanobacter]UJJ49810.1 hypothetical protein LRK52_11255 [Rhodanobacter denitrificans]UJM92523.1 hypothetical protein LRK32_11165 [Rhodanobacter denitrificans]UJM96053.1 hypothetical protein LRK44_11170 [Rhodanobacter denitrificans]UJN21116.1 hypothetical protein LRK54_15470 [Rhodanobacter denitrificans]
MGLRQRRQPLAEHLFPRTAHTVVEVYATPGLRGETPAQHAQRGRDPDAAGDQHHRHVGVGIEHEAAGRRLHLEHVADVHRVMEMVRDLSRRKLRPAGAGVRLTVMR